MVARVVAVHHSPIVSAVNPLRRCLWPPLFSLCSRPMDEFASHFKEPAPCDKCAGAVRCGAELLACTAFARFDAGRPWADLSRSDANRGIYDAVFGRTKAKG
jgi:hypothetical protein